MTQIETYFTNHYADYLHVVMAKSLTEETLMSSIKQIPPLSKALKKKFSDMTTKLNEYNVQPASL